MLQGVRIQPVQVFVVAPPMVGWGLERLIQTAHPRVELLGTAASMDDAWPALEKHIPDVLVADLDTDGFGCLAELHARLKTYVLLLTGLRAVEDLDNAVLAGVRGLVKKCDPPSILIKAIEKVREGELWIDRGATSRIFMEMARRKAAQGDDPESTKIATLTSRERQTIIAVTSDAAAPAKVIASRLCISEHTLRNHLTSIYNKLQVSNRLDLYAYATRHSLDKAAR
jgi:two-component system, NarL family, nitrate/nitrite response regulator NarL